MIAIERVLFFKSLCEKPVMAKPFRTQQKGGRKWPLFTSFLWFRSVFTTSTSQLLKVQMTFILKNVPTQTSRCIMR